MARNEYTTQDSAGFEVKQGDRVTISFTATVTSVTRDGMAHLKTDRGSFTAHYADYQDMHKIHESLPEYLGLNDHPNHDEVRKTFNLSRARTKKRNSNIAKDSNIGKRQAT